MLSRLNPYVGPRYFTRDEKIYGRTQEINRLNALLTAERIVLLYSPSGAGKTSLINAGLVPRLIKDGFDVLETIRVNLPTDPYSPKNRYVFSALVSLEKNLPEDQQIPLEELAKLSLPEYFANRPREIPEGKHFPPPELLIFDQFEEIITTDSTDLEGKKEFFSQVAEVLYDQRRWALFSMREDFIATLDPYVRVLPTRLENRFRLDLLTTNQAKKAIQIPAKNEDVEFLDEAALKLLEDLSKVTVVGPTGGTNQIQGEYVEPVHLQVVCYELWKRLPDDAQEITPDDVQSMGDVDQSLGAFYSDKVHEAAASKQEIERRIRDWFEYDLITENNIRNQVLLDNKLLGKLDVSVLESLENAYLIRRDSRRNRVWFELSHDRMVKPVRASNRAWYNQNLNKLQRQSGLWHRQNQPENLLLTGEDLITAEDWANANPESLTPEEKEYLQACLRQRERQEAIQAEKDRRFRQMRVMLVIVVFVALIAIFLGVLARNSANEAQNQRSTAEQAAYRAETAQFVAELEGANAQTQEANALTQKNNADEQRKRAEENVSIAQTALADEERSRLTAEAAEQKAINAAATAEANLQLAEEQAILARSGQLSSQSESAQVQYPQRSLLLAVEAVRSAESKGVSPPLLSIQALYDALHNAGGMAVIGSSDDVWTVAVSQDGNWMAAGGPSKQVYLWDISGIHQGKFDPATQPFAFSGHTDSIMTVLFVPGKPWLASTSRDGSLRFWPLPPDGTGEPLFVFEAHTDAISTMKISPDGTLLAVGGQDNKITLWDLSGDMPTLKAELPNGGDPNDLAFSGNGAFLISGSTDTRLRLWDLSEIDQDPIIYEQGSKILRVAINFGARLAASGDEDGNLFLWDLTSPPFSAPIPLIGHTGEIRSLAFDPQGRWLASGSTDDNVILWNLQSTAERVILRGHEGGVIKLSFIQGGDILVSASIDNTLRLWDLSLSDPGNSPVILRGHEGAVRDFVMFPGDEFLLSGSTDNRLRIWDLRASIKSVRQTLGVSPMRLTGHTADIRTMDFSSDGRWLATAGRDVGVVILWDLSAPDPQTSAFYLRGHTDDISVVRFSPDGRYLATAGGDRQILVWDVAGGNFEEPLYTLRGHGSRITGLAFTSDSHQLLSASRDWTLRRWTLGDPGETVNEEVFNGHQFGIESLALEPDGCIAATGDRNGVVFLWDLCASEPTGRQIWPDDAVTTAEESQVNETVVYSLEISQDGKYLAAGFGGDSNGYMVLWRENQTGFGDVLLQTDLTGAILDVGFSPDSKWLASGSADNRVRLYPIDDLDKPYILQRTEVDILNISYTPDSRWLVIGGFENVIRLFDLSARNPTGQSIELFSDNPVYVIAVDPQGQFLASGTRDPDRRGENSPDNPVRVWSINIESLYQAACQSTGRNFTGAEWDFYFPDEAYHKTCDQWP